MASTSFCLEHVSRQRGLLSKFVRKKKKYLIVKMYRSFFYIAQYPERWITQSALHFKSPGRHVHPYTNSTSLEAITHAAIRREDYSLTFPPLSIVRYSFIQLSELRRRGENEMYPSFETVSNGIQILSIGSSAFYR